MFSELSGYGSAVTLLCQVWVVEEAVGGGLVMVVRAEDIRSSLLCVEATAEWQC